MPSAPGSWPAPPTAPSRRRCCGRWRRPRPSLPRRTTGNAAMSPPSAPGPRATSPAPPSSGAAPPWHIRATCWRCSSAQIGDFLLGYSQMLRDRVARVLPHWHRDVPGYGFILGMHAFGLEEAGDYARAEASGREAVALNPRDGWAVHAVAHVLEMNGRTEEGVGWLRDSAGSWAPGNMFAYHNWWHLALFHLDRGEIAEALRLFDERGLGRRLRPGDGAGGWRRAALAAAAAGASMSATAGRASPPAGRRGSRMAPSPSTTCTR